MLGCRDDLRLLIGNLGNIFQLLLQRRDLNRCHLQGLPCLLQLRFRLGLGLSLLPRLSFRLGFRLCHRLKPGLCPGKSLRLALRLCLHLRFGFCQRLRICFCLGLRLLRLGLCLLCLCLGFAGRRACFRLDLERNHHDHHHQNDEKKRHHHHDGRQGIHESGPVIFLFFGPSRHFRFPSTRLAQAGQDLVPRSISKNPPAIHQDHPVHQ